VAILTDRLSIAAQISAGIFAGVPYGLDDFEQTQDLKDAEKKTVKAIARLSLMVAEELIIADHERPTIAELRMERSNVQIRLAHKTEA
jgi:hypothetical protein